MKVKMTWEFIPEQLLEVLIDNHIIEKGSKISFEIEQKPFQSTIFDQPRYESIVNKIIITNENDKK